MEIIRTMLLVGAGLVAAWFCLLLIGMIAQLKQIRRNWVEGRQAPVPQNVVFNHVLKVLGVSEMDRLTCGCFIFSALMLWPVTLLLGVPLVKIFRDRERRTLANQIVIRDEEDRLSLNTSSLTQSRSLEMHQ
jgi:hypothetical protein